jgi:hypothetical protein
VVLLTGSTSVVLIYRKPDHRTLELVRFGEHGELGELQVICWLDERRAGGERGRVSKVDTPIGSLSNVSKSRQTPVSGDCFVGGDALETATD